MTHSSIRRRALSTLFALSLVAGCSGSRDDSLGTQNIGRTDGAVLADEDAEVEGNEADGGDGEQIDGGEDDAGDFDAIVSVEVADAGEAPDSTVIVETSLCGNGQADPGEQCDQGASNSDTVAGACRLNCRSAHCGDGVVDQGEACDQGASNSDSEANACRANCTVARCGDSVIDQGEQCDTGDARSDTAAGACRLTCRSARCGDGVRDTDEGCDDGNQVDTDMCRNTCRSARCGDGVQDPEEECDDGNTVNTDTCRDACRRPICGDRVVDSGEQCDDGNQVNNDGCRSNCRTGCANDAACSDGLFCTGVERCVDGLCNPGVGVNPDDNLGCTMDVCREDLDRVVHTPNDALCVPRGPTCTGARGTTRTATCNVTTGCVEREINTACSDEPSACELRGDGSYTLLTYRPACEDSMSCGDATQASQVCAHIPASCNNRVFTGRANATCNPNTESCGNAAPTTDNCATRDSSSCAAGNTSFTRVMGTCSTTGGCGTTTTGPTACSDPADTCANATRTTYVPTCSAGTGCGTPAATNTPCTQASGPSCGATGPNGQAALTTYTPACDPSGNGQCSTTGVPQGAPQVCTPRVASICGNTSTRIPQETIYTPACSGSSCSPTGTPSTPANCTAPSGSSCAVNAGVPQVTSHVPSCDAAGSRCMSGGRTVVTDCTAPAGTFCRTANDRASLVTFAPACDPTNASSCSTTGTIATAVPCTSQPITCSGNNEVRSVGQCQSDTSCATSSTACVQQSVRVCTSTTGFETRRYSGTCTNGTGCAYAAAGATTCAPTCGTGPAGNIQACTSTCATNSDGAFCQQTCVNCPNGCLGTSCRLIVQPGIGGVISPGGIVTQGDTVAPGAGILSL